MKFTAKLDGFQELGSLNNETGAILTGGKGTLTLTLDRTSKTISFELTFSGLSANVTQSHIHFGRVHTPGGIMVFLCTNLGNGGTDTPACPASGGTVTRTRSAGDVLAVKGQNVTAGDFDALTDALLSSSAYVNVHTVNFPAGEMRGQIRLERPGRDRGPKVARQLRLRRPCAFSAASKSVELPRGWHPSGVYRLDTGA